MWCNASESFVDVDDGLVAEVALGGLYGEAVRCGELFGEEPGHWRFASEHQGPPEHFESGSESTSISCRDRACDGGQFGEFEQAVDPVPQFDTFGFIDEIGFAGVCGIGFELVGSLDVSGGGVFDVGG